MTRPTRPRFRGLRRAAAMLTLAAVATGAPTAASAVVQTNDGGNVMR